MQDRVARTQRNGQGKDYVKGQPFIPSWLDDAMLTPAQFRVLCHVARRGDCYESLPAFAERCCMHRETIQSALNYLVERGYLTKEPRVGQTSIYRLAPSGNGGLGSGTTQRKRGARCLAEKGGYPPSGKGGLRRFSREGSPRKVLSARGAAKKSGGCSLEMILEAAKEIGMPQPNAESCFYSHQSRGAKIVDARAALECWKRSPHYKEAEGPSPAEPERTAAEIFGLECL